MRSIWVGRSTAWLLSLVVPSGCALSAQAPSPNRPTGTPPSCTTKKTAVTADWIGAGAGLSLGVASADASAPLAAALFASGGLLALSAITGNRRVNQCRDAYEAYFVERSIEPPDNYGDYAVVADREAKRLRQVTAKHDTEPPRPTPTPNPEPAPDEPGTARPQDASKSAPEHRWNEFWSEQL